MRVLVTLAFRRARPDECGVLSELALRSKAHWGYSHDFLEACREELRVSESSLRDPDVLTVVAARGSTLVGFYSLAKLDPSTFELDALFVEPAHIGGGSGRALFEHARSEARRPGVTRLVIQSDPHSEGFYRAMGARRVGERPSASIAGRDLPLYEIDLRPTAGRGDSTTVRRTAPRRTPRLPQPPPAR